MNWQHFQTHNEASTRSFEAMCNQLFDLWCCGEYGDSLISVTTINGACGDGGVESLALLKDNTCIGLQAKWFPDTIDAGRIAQIKSSVQTALKVRPSIIKYIVCVPRDLTSSRYGKNGNLITNNERTRWENLKATIQNDYSCELALWDETRLLTLLQEEKAAGIYRFWFEKSEITNEAVRHVYAKQCAGWLKHKYIPDLHASGRISTILHECIGTDSIRQNLLGGLGRFEALCKSLLSECSEYEQYDVKLKENCSLSKEINSAKSIVNDILQEIDLTKKLVKCDTTIADAINSEKWRYSFSKLIEELEKGQYDSHRRAHKDDLLKAAKNMDEYDRHNLFDDIKKSDQRLLILLGQPGTGKTHAIAGFLQSIFEENRHVAILIHAKDYLPELGWKSILTQALGLSDNWTELEIWNALESLAYRLETASRILNESEIHLKSKVLIFIDGVDEKVPYTSWIERFRETKAICTHNERIRFSVTCRPYVFSEMAYDDDLRLSSYNIPPNGDVSISDLYPSYIQHYNIDDKNSPWIRWSLKTPLALRTFCDLYRDRKIADIPRSSITITRLLESTIKQIEKGFVSAYGLAWSDRDFIVHKILMAFLSHFTSSRDVPREILLKEINSILVTHSTSPNCSGQLLDHLENYGLIHSIQYQSPNLLQPTVVKYSIGIHPFFDYLAASYTIDSLNSPNELNLTPLIVQHEGALQMLAVLLLEDHEYLVINNKSVQKAFGKQKLFELACFALSNVSPGVTEKYAPYVRFQLQQSPQRLRDTVNKIVAPVARIQGHPLGPILLDEHLRTFTTPGQRDLAWSLPSTLWHNSPWQIQEPWILINDDIRSLTEWDSHLGMPLIYAWLLTSCDNTVRHQSRQRLMHWALVRPDEYWLLFEKTVGTNDTQMKEDLFGIAMGLVFSSNKNDPHMTNFKDWLLNSVFTPEGINEYFDAAIRYYCHAMMERFHALHLVSDEQIKLCRPPYATSKLLHIEKDALSGTRMGGYGPIDYDLSRYVLCDPIERMFFGQLFLDRIDEFPDAPKDYSQHFTQDEIVKLLKTEDDLTDECRVSLYEALQIHLDRHKSWERLTARISYIAAADKVVDTDDDEPTQSAPPRSTPRQMSEEASDILKLYSDKYAVKDIQYHGFVNALAYAFLLEMGWNKEEFFGHPNGGRPGEVLGADVVIQREYHAATHGTMSQVMTFAEKYVWCARNVIFGFLADRLPFYDDQHLAFLEDYSLLDDFPNPAQELQEFSRNINASDVWYLPEDLLCVPEDISRSDCLKQWIHEAPMPNFEKWITPAPTSHPLLQDGWMSLFGFNALTNSINGETLMWISSGMISKRDFPLFYNDINNMKDSLKRDFHNPADYHTSTQAQCYLTPKEICWMNWKNEYENPVKYVTVANGQFVQYELYKCVEECVGHYLGKGDVYYKLPSKRVRQYLGITDGNGQSYYDANCKTVAKYHTAGEGWENLQSYLWVDKQRLQNELDRDEMMLFWLVRLQREATTKGMERHPDATEQYDRCWLCWLENGKWTYSLYRETF